MNPVAPMLYASRPPYRHQCDYLQHGRCYIHPDAHGHSSAGRRRCNRAAEKQVWRSETAKEVASR